jgi:hypothetical protein
VEDAEDPAPADEAPAEHPSPLDVPEGTSGSCRSCQMG